MSGVRTGSVAGERMKEPLYRERLLPPPASQHKIETVSRRPLRDGAQNRLELLHLSCYELVRRAGGTRQEGELQQELRTHVAHVFDRCYEPTPQSRVSRSRCAHDRTPGTARPRDVAPFLDEAEPLQRRQRPVDDRTPDRPDLPERTVFSQFENDRPAVGLAFGDNREDGPVGKGQCRKRLGHASNVPGPVAARDYSTARITSVALTTTMTGLPTSRPSSSAASLVIDDVPLPRIGERSRTRSLRHAEA
jgi:hypothetical protein